MAPFTYPINWFKMAGYGKLQNDSDNQDDPDVDQSAQTNGNVEILSIRWNPQ